MLAFTMQFSKHERTPTLTPPPNQPHIPRRGHRTAVWRPGQPARSNPAHQPGEQDPKRPEETDQQPPTRKREAIVPVSSGPNSVSGRAAGQRWFSWTPEGSTHIPDRRDRPSSQCSTYERTHPRDVRSWHGPGPASPEPDGSRGVALCSLERR
jgi:hypothetical protein